MIYLNGTRYETVKDAMAMASAALGRVVRYEEIRSAADRNGVLSGRMAWLRAHWYAPAEKGKAGVLLRYPPKRGPLYSFSEWRLYV